MRERILQLAEDIRRNRELMAVGWITAPPQETTTYTGSTTTEPTPTLEPVDVNERLGTGLNS